MYSLEEIMNMTPDELEENWDQVADSSMKLIGAREMTEAEKQELDSKEETK